MSAEGDAGHLDEFESWLKAQALSRKTIVSRMTFARARWADWGTWNVPAADVAEFLTGHDGWTRLTYQNHARSLFRFLHEAGHVEKDPTRGMRRAPSPTPTPKPLAQDELEHLLATAPSRDVLAILLLASKAGLRLHEIAKIRGEDLTPHGLLVLGKGQKLARLPIHPAIAAIAAEFPAEGWWFPSPHEKRGDQPVSTNCIAWRVRQHFRANGITGGVHRCRATYGTTLARRGVPIHVVQDLMRHTSLATTQHYLGVDEAERTAAIDLI